MAVDRFVVLGLAHARSSWFRDLARWSTTAMVPVEFIKAMSLEEVRARLRAGRGYSAVLVDGSVVGLDRDLIDLAGEAGCAVIVVAGDRAPRDWVAVGAAAVLPAAFDRAALLQSLGQVATPIARVHAADGPPAAALATPSFQGRLVAVTGAGGAGSSTMAIAIAQTLGDDARYRDQACLADLALGADQAVLHGAPDVVPGVVELVDAHRTGQPGIDEVRTMTWLVGERGYRLLLGVRRHRDWVALRPRAFQAALDGLRRSFRAVVADVDRDLEGEAETGSMDVEERNVMARTAIRQADVVVVVGQPGLKGLHGLLRSLRDVVDSGVPATQVLPVVNRAPRRARARREVVEALGELASTTGRLGLPEVCLVPENRHLEGALLDGTALPRSWAAPLGGAVLEVLEGAENRGAVERPAPARIEPGSLGSWTDQGATAEEAG